MKVFLKTWCLILFVCAESILSMSNECFDCKFPHQKLEKIPLSKPFKNTKNIDLSYNRIRGFDEITHLKNLTQLNISHNLITNIPKEIEELKNLVQLNLAHNIIFEIPTKIGMLEKLIFLNLEYNQLKSIPSILGNLSNLDQLNLSHNFINNLPEEL